MNHYWRSSCWSWTPRRNALQQARYDNRNNRLKNKHRR